MITKRILGKTGLRISEIGFGALEIGRNWAPDVNADPSHLSEKEAAYLLNSILDMGINFIDTAPAYWYSEEYIGKGISHRRKEFYLATKVGEHCDPSGSVYDYSFNATLNFIDRSLKLLKTDYIDLLQIHSASIEVIEKGETLSAMESAKKAGKILHIGMTGNVEACIKAIETGGYETVQFPYNIINYQAEDKLIPLAEQNNIGMIIMRPLAGGKLTDKYKNIKDEGIKNAIGKYLTIANIENNSYDLAEIAIAYILANKSVSTIIAGSRYLKNIEKNVHYSKKVLPKEIIDDIKNYSQSINIKAW